MNAIKLWLCVLAMIFPCVACSGQLTKPTQVASADPAPAPAATPDVSTLAADFAAATAMACAPVSATDASPIDPAACTCNTFLAAFLPNLKPDNQAIKGVISGAEWLRIQRIRLNTGDSKLKFQMACGALHMQLRDDALTAALFVGQLAK